MLSVPRDISVSDFNKLYLRANRSPVVANFTLQGFSLRSTGLTELLIPNNEVLLLPRGAGANIELQGVKYDFRADGAAGRYNASFAVTSQANGVLTISALGSDGGGFATVISSNPNTVEFGLDTPQLPNVPGQQYLRIQTRGVSNVDIQFVAHLRIVTTQPLLG